MRLLFAPPSQDDLIRLLRAWRYWLLGALAGALLGAAVFLVSPPSYRARATVDVDFHAEQAWPVDTNREQFYYLEQEVRKLEDIAWSDRVLNAAAASLSPGAFPSAQSGRLQLGQPGNGGWHFYADARNRKDAAAYASAWAKAFAADVTAQLAGSSSDLEKFISVDATQVESPPVYPSVSLSTYLLAGALGFLALSAFAVLFFDLHR